MFQQFQIWKQVSFEQANFTFHGKWRSRIWKFNMRKNMHVFFMSHLRIEFFHDATFTFQSPPNFFKNHQETEKIELTEPTFNIQCGHGLWVADHTAEVPFIVGWDIMEDEHSFLPILFDLILWTDFDLLTILEPGHYGLLVGDCELQGGGVIEFGCCGVFKGSSDGKSWMKNE